MQIIASPESGISCDKQVDIVTVAPSDEPAVTVSSTCHDSPEPEINCDSAKSELTGCDQDQDVSQVMELRREWG